MTELKIPFEFVDGVDAAAGEHLTFPQFRPGLRSRYGGHLTDGEAACFASHAVQWEACAAGTQNMLILEDNVDLADEFVGALEAANSELGRGASYVRLGATISRRSVTVRKLSGHLRVVRYLKGPSGGQAYAITPEGARTLLDALSVWAEPLDDYLDRFWIHGLPALAIHPISVTRAAIPTTIHGRSWRLTGHAYWRRKLVRNWDGLRRLVFNAGLAPFDHEQTGP